MSARRRRSRFPIPTMVRFAGAGARLLCGAALLSTVGCGELYDADYDGEPLLVISGQVSVGEAAPPERPRAALLWLSAAPTGLVLRADDVPIETSFPSNYTIEVRRIPSDRAFPGRWDRIDYLPPVEGLRTLFGVLTIYDDLDDNQQADFDYSGYHLLELLNGRSWDPERLLIGPDRLLGVAPDLLVAAVELPELQWVEGEWVVRETDLLDGFLPLDRTELAPLGGLQQGLHGYRYDAIAERWVQRDTWDDVELQLD